MNPTNNKVEVDCKHFELCFHSGKQMAVGVNSQAGFMSKCLNCGAEELVTVDSQKIEAIKELIRWNEPESVMDSIEFMESLKEIVEE